MNMKKEKKNIYINKKYLISPLIFPTNQVRIVRDGGHIVVLYILLTTKILIDN
jgi:hypothetical protein